MGAADDTVGVDERRKRAASDARVLRVVGENIQLEVPLPASGMLLIGRAEGADIRIDDPSVSRKHALLHVDGPRMRVEDLGGHNGTSIAGRRLEAERPEEVELGAVIAVGAVMLVIASRAAVSVADDIVVRDPKMIELHRMIAQVARGEISVLLLGETGVGKEAIAEAIHRASDRAPKPLVRINSAALSDQLLESELFGHEKGAFTGAERAKPGLFETAEGGTVFLDEVGELPPAIQAKLLRVLEDRKVKRVGAVESVPIDVRFVAATNRDLEAAVERGEFRRDLFFRLNGVTLVVPPLREREGEIEPLALKFLAGRRALGEDALDVLRAWRWPGNVRELRNVIERAVLLSTGVIEPKHLPEAMRQPESHARASRSGAEGSPEGKNSDSEFRKIPSEFSPEQAPRRGGAAPLKTELDAVERDRILRVLEECGGNQTRAAKQLGISRNTLASRLEAYGLPRPRKAPR